MTDIASPTTLDGARVLLIDDVPHNLKLLRFILSKAGATVMEATCADEARAQLTGALPDIILMDILMPGTNGYDLCRQLKAQPDTAHIPVIFLSALNEGMDKAQAFAVGGSDYVTKPYSPPEVLARVTHHVRMVRMQQELAREAKRLAQLNNELVRAHGETRAVFGALGQNLLGQVLDGKYVLQAQIGSGGYAVVYRAIAMGTQQAVAVKVYRPVSEATKAARQMSRFRQEEAATRLGRVDGVDHQHVEVVAPCVVQRGQRDVVRLLVRRGGKPLGPGLRGDGLQLLDGGGAVDVRRHGQHLLLALFDQVARDLGGGRGLARALQAGHQDDRGRLRGQVQVGHAFAHRGRQFAVHDAHQRLAGVERAHHLLAQGFFLDAGDEVAHHRQRHVGLQQGHAHLAQHVLDVAVGDARLAAHRLDQP